MVDIEKYLLVDIFDAYLYDSEDRLIFMSENLTSSDITGSADEVEVRNGKSNSLFAKLFSNKTIDVSLKTNVFSFDTLALLCGTTVATGTGTAYSECQDTVVKSGGFVLNEIPKYPERVQAFIGNDEITLAFDETDKTIVEVDADYEDKAVKIMPYEFDCDDSEMQEIVVKADEFPEACKLVLKSYLKTKKNKVWKNLTIEIPEASLASDFSLSTSSEVAPTETEIKLSALSNNGKLMRVTLTDLTTEKTEVKLTGDVTWADEVFKVYAKGADGTDNPPYDLFTINYVRSGELAKVECTMTDKDTNEVYYHETNTTKLTEGNGSFIYSLRKGLADYDTMSQAEKDAIERSNDTIISANTEVIITIKMTDINGNEKEIVVNYVVSKKDVKMVTYTV